MPKGVYTRTEEMRKNMRLSHVGNSWSKTSRDKLSNTLTGRLLTDSWKKNISLSKKGKANGLLGRLFTEEEKQIRKLQRQGMSSWNKGHSYTEEERKRFGSPGEKHWNWKGGLSLKKYDKTFTAKRRYLVRMLNNCTCAMCGATEAEKVYTFHVHHINYNKQDSRLDNLTLLCRRCHQITNYDRTSWYNFFKGNYTPLNVSLNGMTLYGFGQEYDYKVDSILDTLSKC